MSYKTVFGAALRADVAGNHLTGIERNSHFHFRESISFIFCVDFRHGRLHFDGAGDGLCRVFFGLCGRTKGGQYGIAQKFINGAAMTQDNVGHFAEIAIQQRDHLLGWQVLN